MDHRAVEGGGRGVGHPDPSVEEAGGVTDQERLQADFKLDVGNINGFCPLGEGDVDIAGVIRTLEGRGYEGWYVIEQDTAITDGLPPEGQGPINQVQTSLSYLMDVVAPTLT
jgi:sugar phosphate isomerase/epimerase